MQLGLALSTTEIKWLPPHCVTFPKYTLLPSKSTHAEITFDDFYDQPDIRITSPELEYHCVNKIVN